MFAGAAPLIAPFWTPPAQPSQQPTWPGGWDQAALAQSFSAMGLKPPVSTKWITDSGASFHTTPDAGILFRCSAFDYFFVYSFCRDAVFHHLAPPAWSPRPRCFGSAQS